jgi:cyclase
MLRRRVITVLTLNDGVLFRTKRFHPDYRYTINFVDTWSVDEIVALDVTRGGGDRNHFYAALDRLATECFVPLAAGGGVRSIDEVHRLLRSGADKIVVNTAAVDAPGLVSEAARLYGSQCVVASIDAHRHSDGRYEVYVEHGTRATGLDPAGWARRLQECGAGEIMITSIERDGSLEGYDNVLNHLVSSAVSIPVLACGGAGKWQDFVDGFVVGGASAVCTTNIYHFTETSIRSAKRFLDAAGIPVRI